MEFLPIRMNGRRVYAGCWKRFCATFADACIIMPIAFLLAWLQALDRTLAIATTIPVSILFAMYNVFFNARFGGSLGKLAVGIRITKPNGTRIDWLEAWKRSAVDLVFACVSAVVQVWVLIQIAPDQHASLGFIEQQQLLGEYYPAWYRSLVVLQQVWIWSEVIVVLLNKRKRAIHDLIAGTVVVKKEFAKQVHEDSDADTRSE